MLKKQNLIRPSKIRIVWLRGVEHVNFKNSSLWFGFGVRGAGKSAFLEALSEHYIAHAASGILDLFAARSAENLAWLRSPWVKKIGLKPLLLKSPKIRVESPYDTLDWHNFHPDLFNKYDIVISSAPLYINFNEEFRAAALILDRLFQRYGWRRYIVILIRESANLFYSRYKLRQDQLASKTEGTYLLREARHHGLICLLDSQRFYGLDIEFRSLTDYLIIKRLGHMSLPRDMFWVYRYIDPTWTRTMKPQHFIILTKTGALGIGEFEMPYWHARPGERILDLLNIKIYK